MGNYLFILIVISLLLSNCASTYMINQTHDRFYLNTGKYRNGQILLSNGQKYKGYDIQIFQDSTSFIEETNNSQDSWSISYSTRKIQTSEIREIVFFNRYKGALLGLGVGMFVGSSVAMLLGLSSGGSEEFSPVETGLLLSLYTCPIAAISGTMIGLGTGSKEKFIINDNSSLNQRKDQ
jgi:hypothetical protein